MIWSMVVLPVALLLLGLPIYLVLLATGTAVLVFQMDIPFMALHQMLFGGVDKFSLLAIPFFIFAGEIMAQGGISKRILDWVLSVIGSQRGSLGLTVVGSSTIFGAMSGSSPATVAAVGRLAYPSLLERGYSKSFSTALIASSGSIAIVIPPSIGMILYGVAAEESVPKLFAAGILPGIVIATVMSLFIVFQAHRHGLSKSAGFRWDVFLAATKHSVWALGTPVIILGGIYAGFFSPTEAAGIACVYAALVSKFAYREASWRKILDMAASSVFLTAQIMIIAASAGVFSWLLTISGVPQATTAYVGGLDVAPWMMLLAINIFLLFVGCIIDPTSAILVLTPLLLPIVRSIGVDPIHFGIIMTVNLSIGMFTPPFGLNIFMAQSLFEVPARVIYRGLLPFIAIQTLALLIITYVPELSLLMTRYLG